MMDGNIEKKETETVTDTDFLEDVTDADFLEDSRRYIKNDMEDLTGNFLKLGFDLYVVKKYEYYKAGGYKSVAEFAETEFGIKKSTCFNLINCMTAYSENHCSMDLDDRYKGYGYSQLVEMLSLPDYGKGVVTPDMSVAKIREVKKFGAPVDELILDEEIENLCYELREAVKPFSRENVKAEIAKRCRDYFFLTSGGEAFRFYPNYIQGKNYRYTQALLLECIEKYSGFEDAVEPEPFQTSGMEEPEEPAELNFEEAHNRRHELPLSEVLMNLLKVNIRNTDKVKAIIEYLNTENEDSGVIPDVWNKEEK